MSTRMQQRKGTAEQWTNVNPTLAEGELGWESDTNSFKIGDGVNAWNSLSYFVDETALSGSLSDYVELVSVGVADGVASLDSNGKLTSTEIPDSLATTTYVDTAVSNLVDTAPEALNTLNELAAALGDDANFATTVTNQIATKADLAHTHLLADVTDVTATASELNVLDGITATTAELNHTDGVTSNIQTQLDGKVDESDGSVTTATAGSAVVRNITLSTATPTGGSDGDVWLVYTA